MALPTVHYFEASAAAGSALLTTWMQKLDDMLVTDAGWTRSFVDADAIGGGSAGDPSWDKAPATSTDAGIAVYQMPANDHTTQWFVRFRPGWAASTSRPYMRGITIGTTHDGSGGVTGAGSEINPSVATVNTDALAWKLAVSEDGFFFHIAASTSVHVIVQAERVRLPDETVTDEVIAAISYSGGEFLHANAASGLLNNFGPTMLTRSSYTGVTTFGAGQTLESRDASEVAVLGPYWGGGYPMFAPPRLARMVSDQAAVAGGDYELPVDGGSKTYRGATLATNVAGRWLIATE